MLHQQEVTARHAQQVAEGSLVHLTEASLSLLELIYPRHVIENLARGQTVAPGGQELDEVAAILSESLLPLISGDEGFPDELPTERPTDQQQQQQHPLQPPRGMMDLEGLTTAHEQVLLLTLLVERSVDAVEVARFKGCQDISFMAAGCRFVLLCDYFFVVILSFIWIH